MLELNSTPPFFKAPSHMLNNLIKNRSLLKNLVAQVISKSPTHGHVLGLLLVVVGTSRLDWDLFCPMCSSSYEATADTLLPLKIMIGILIFNSFSRTLSSCTACLVANTSLIQQVYFPREIFPTAIAGFRLINLFLSMIIIIPYMIYEKIQPTGTILLLPIAMCSAILLAQGIGMMAASVQVRIRDIKQVIDLILRAAFFLSGVFFGAEHIPPEHLEIFFMNPIAVYIEMARSAILGDMSLLTWSHIFRAIALSIGAFLLGSIIFVKSERKAVKFL